MLDNNLKYIARYNPKLAETIKYHKVLGNVGFVQAQSGDYVLTYNNIPFHSMEDPQKEASDTFGNINNTNHSAIHVIFGLGLGYVLKRLYLSSKGRILIVEPNMDILRVTLEAVDFSVELADDRVMLLDIPLVQQDNLISITSKARENLEAAFKKYYIYEDPVNLSFLPVYKTIYPDVIASLSDELAFMKGYFNNNYYTLYEASQDWLNMSLINFNYLLDSMYIDCLKDKFKNIPAIIVSAGPSLVKNIEQLKEFQDRALIFAVSSSLRKLKEGYNIIPQFATFIDSSEELLPLIDGVSDLEKINFIYQPSTYNGIYKLNTKRSLVYLPNNDFFSNWVAKILKINNQNYRNRGTVSITAFSAAQNFGCNPVIYVGQDLAYTNEGQVYADEEIKVLYDKRNMLCVPGWDGKAVQTNSSYAIFIRYFENLAKEFPDVKIINATEGGAFIRGIEHMSFKEASKLIPETKIDVEAIISQAESEYLNPFKSSKVPMLNAIKGNYSAISKLLTIVKKARTLCTNIEREMEKANINKTHVLKIFNDLYELNGKLDRVINEDCTLITCYIQKECYAFSQEFERIKDFNNFESIKLYIDLAKAYYDAIDRGVPNLSEKLENILKVKVK